MGKNAQAYQLAQIIIKKPIKVISFEKEINKSIIGTSIIDEYLSVLRENSRIPERLPLEYILEIAGNAIPETELVRKTNVMGI